MKIEEASLWCLANVRVADVIAIVRRLAGKLFHIAGAA